jgi:hypothetical protein
MMPETVIYMRGSFPFGQEFSPRLILDAKELLSVEVDVLRALAAELDAYTGFLDKQALGEIIAHYIPDADKRKHLTRLIGGLDERLRTTKQSLDSLVAEIRDRADEDEERKKILSPGDIEELAARLPLIIKPYPSLRRQGKAKRLAGVTGQALEELEIICDLRPIFDPDRTEVEGVVPLTTLKVVCKGVDGLPVAMEAILTEKQVHNLAEKAQAAERKLERLRELLAKKSLTIPSIEMTERGE